MKIWNIGTNIQSYINSLPQIYNKLAGKAFTIYALNNIIPNKYRYFFRSLDGKKEAFWQDDKSGKSYSTFQQILSTWLSMGLIKLSGQNKTLEKRDLLNETYEFLIKDDNLNKYLNDYFKTSLKEKIKNFKITKELKEDNDFFWQYANEEEFYFSLFITFLYNYDFIPAAEVQKFKLHKNITALENWKINNIIDYKVLKEIAIDFVYGSENNMKISVTGFEEEFDPTLSIKETNYKNRKIRIESQAKTYLEFLTWLEKEHYILKVPVYQRRYTWTQEIITYLVNDIFKTSQNFDKEAHYIGEIILHRKDISSLHEQKQISKIVDGQQRFTSLLLILRVVRDIMVTKKMSPTKEIEQYFRLIPTEIEDENKLTILFRHIDGSQDFQDFRNLMLGKTHKLENSSKFLINYKTVTKILEGYEFNQIYDFVKTLLNQIVMTVTIDEVSDEFELFENMNTHKMELEILDLIRDIIMMHIKPEVLDNKEKDILNYFDVHITNQFVDKFKNKINFFIKAYIKLYKLELNEHSNLFKKLKDLNKDIDLYDNFKEIVKDLINKFTSKTSKEMNLDEFKNLVDYLHRYITLYLNIVDSKQYFNSTNQFYQLGDILSAFEQREIYNPIIMYLIEQNSTYDNKQYLIKNLNYLRSLLFAFETYEMRFQVVIYRGQSLSATMDTLLQEIHQKKEKLTYDDLIELLSSSRMGNIALPSIETFQKKLSEEELAANKTVSKLCARLEFYLNNNYKISVDKNHRYLPFKAPTREHIMPQHYNNEWETYLLKQVNNKEDLIIKHKKYLNLIGNTLTINEWTNSKASNASFSRKQEVYNDEPNVYNLKQYLGINNSLLLMNINNKNEWSFKDIEERSKQMAIIFNKIYSNFC